MEKKTKNKIIMLKATLSLMEQNNGIWQEAVPLANAVGQTSDLLDQIEQIKQTINRNNSGLVAAKEGLKADLISLAFELASTLAAFAEQTENPVLLSKVDYPVSYLQNVRDGELPTICNALHTLIGEKLADLETYGVTAEKANEFLQLISEYEASLPSVRVTVSARMASNEKIKELVKEAMQVTTNQTDRLMVKFKLTNPDFYNAYLNARKIVDYGTRHEKGEDDETPESPAPEA